MTLCCASADVEIPVLHRDSIVVDKSKRLGNGSSGFVVQCTTTATGNPKACAKVRLRGGGEGMPAVCVWGGGDGCGAAFVFAMHCYELPCVQHFCCSSCAQLYHIIEAPQVYGVIPGGPAYRVELARIRREATALACLDHPNLLKLQGAVKDAHGDITVLVSPSCVFPLSLYHLGCSPSPNALLPSLVQILDFADRNLEQYCASRAVGSFPVLDQQASSPMLLLAEICLSVHVLVVRPTPPPLLVSFCSALR
jgi:hypothetical protein